MKNCEETMKKLILDVFNSVKPGMKFGQNHPDKVIFLVGLKSDLGTARSCSFAKMEKLASHFQLGHTECSAKSGHNIKNLFNELILVMHHMLLYL